MTDEGFVKGQSDNLPTVDMFMVASFMQNAEDFSLGEVRGVKASKYVKYYSFKYYCKFLIYSNIRIQCENIMKMYNLTTKYSKQNI